MLKVFDIPFDKEKHCIGASYNRTTTPLNLCEYHGNTTCVTAISCEMLQINPSLILRSHNFNRLFSLHSMEMLRS